MNHMGDAILNFHDAKANISGMLEITSLSLPTAWFKMLRGH